ncbi:MAG: MFS transporter, partial [Bacteroidales bacterium]|nr:MFS transporter [Bacteroidales bacterium]
MFIGLMIVGGIIKAYGVSDHFNNGGFGYEFFNSFATKYEPSVKLATLGFALFGLGIEITGITVNRIIVKWFKGKELALAMGLQMACARMGMAGAYLFSPLISNNISVSKPVVVGILFLAIGFISFLVHCMGDRKLDKEMASEKTEGQKFKTSDIGLLFKNKGFTTIALLCVLFYSCVFPFMKFAPNLLINKYGVSTELAGSLSIILPIGTILLTPLLGSYIDKQGKGASMMILGSILLVIVHSIFAFLPGNILFAYVALFILGVAFSLIPSA